MQNVLAAGVRVGKVRVRVGRALVSSLLAAAVLTGCATSPTATSVGAPAADGSASPLAPDSSQAAGALAASPSVSAQPAGSSGTPRTSPRPKPATTKPAAAAPASRSSRKGVSVWSFNGVNQALTQSGATWYYTWATGHSGITTPSGVGFVPMIWGPGSVTTTNLAQAKNTGSKYLLGFNEPDMSAQSNMTVEKALSLWPQLESTGMALGSPAVATGGATAGGWLDRFMSGAASKGYRVDFITLHWYGGDFNSSNATSQLKSYLSAVYNRYHKTIWLTEYALIDFSNGTRYPSQAQQAAFVTSSIAMLDSLPYLARYAWFALPAADSGASTGLFQSGPKATQVGKAYEQAS